MPKRRPKSRSCHRKPLCTRAVLISVSFKSDEHQYSSSRASATDEPNATLRRVSSLQMTPMHSHYSRSSSSRHSRKEVCACIWRTGTQHRPSPPNSTKASKTMSSSGVYGASDSLSSLSDASCPGSTVASELSLEAASSVCVVSRGPSVPFGCTSPSHRASCSASNELPTWCVITVTSSS